MKRIRNVDVERVFTRKAKKLLIKNPSLEDKYKETVSMLVEDPFHFSLKTHPLHGKLKGRYACSITDDLRIVFKLTSNTLHLLDIGTHDEVY
ncbi:MAG: type II toxin-antitoxin system mRNA interferase toxin, RelE/StbE family [Nitrospirae bacterium]|nr:type II toxin-antitoxin system mRNA interferase toxin, RelE/StbE family [Nitrospirota bacterium]